MIITKLIGGFLSLLGVLAVFRGAWGLLVGLFAALGGPLTIVLTLVRVLSGAFATVAGGAIGLVAAVGGLPLLLAAVGAALGFLAVRLAQGINWKKLSDGAAAVVRSIVGFFAGLWETVNGLFSTGIAAIAGLWAGVTNAALAVWASIAAGAGVLWVGLATLWHLGIQQIQNFWNSIAAGATVLWVQLNGLFQAGFDFLSAGWSVIVAAVQAVFDGFRTLVRASVSGIVFGAQAMWDTITGAFSSGVNAIIGFLTRVRDFAISVWTAIAGAARGAASAQESAAAAGATGFARGGPIHGPGTATSDSVPIWASAGEFMVRAAAVRKYGVSIFHALNAMRLPKGAFRGFSQGGLIDRLQVMMPPIDAVAFRGWWPDPGARVYWSVASAQSANWAGVVCRPSGARGRRAEAAPRRRGAPGPQRWPKTQLRLRRNFMANAIYPKTKKRFMAGDIDLSAVAVYAALINVSGVWH